jgi:hypothetical protein
MYRVWTWETPRGSSANTHRRYASVYLQQVDFLGLRHTEEARPESGE